MQPRKVLDSIAPYVAGQSRKGAFKLSSNENPLGTSLKALEAIQRELPNLNRYPDKQCLALRESLAVYYNLSKNNIIVGNGSDEVMLLAAGAYMESDCNAITFTPTFSEYAFASKLFGGTMRYAQIQDGKLDLEQILSLADDKTKLIWLCNPNNPTGTYFPESEFLTFMQRVPTNTLVVVDEAYADYAQAADFPKSLGLFPKFSNLLILRTFSKIYGLAGLRIGIGIADPDIIADMDRARSPFNVNSLARAAITAALEDKKFVDHSIQTNEQGKQFLYESFDKLGLRYYKTQANFIFAYMPQNGIIIFQELLKGGVAIRPLKSFGIDNAIRVSVGTPEQNRKCVDLLGKVLNK